MPASLPLQRVAVRQNQRVDAIDWNDTSRLSLENLFLFARHGFAHANGWITNGNLVVVNPTIGAPATVQLDPPVCAIAPQGLAILDASRTFVVPATPSVPSGHIRRDVIAITQTETDGGSALRRVINPVTGVQSDVPVNTRRVWNDPGVASSWIALYTGTPALPGAAMRPTIPAGWVPLWEVVVNGTTGSISSTHLVPSYSQIHSNVLTYIFTGDGVAHDIDVSPYVTPTIGSLEVPNGTAALLDVECVIRVLPVLAPPPAPVDVPVSLLRRIKPVTVELFDTTTSTALGVTEVTPLYEYDAGALMTASKMVECLARVRGVLFPTGGVRHDISLRIERTSGSGGEILAQKVAIATTSLNGKAMAYILSAQLVRIVP